MKKIISLFKRNYDGDRQIYNEVTPGAEWVVLGEGVATEKLDGTCCMVRDGKLYKRYDAKNGKTPPVDFEEAQAPDPITGHHPGWVPVKAENPEDKWHMQVFMSYLNCPDGTYELIGRKIQGNPYEMDIHILVPHGKDVIDPRPPCDFDGLRKWLESKRIEGIVWHHPDGRMVKIKRRDFGLPWPVRQEEK